MELAYVFRIALGQARVLIVRHKGMILLADSTDQVLCGVQAQELLDVPGGTPTGGDALLDVVKVDALVRTVAEHASSIALTCAR